MRHIFCLSLQPDLAEDARGRLLVTELMRAQRAVESALRKDEAAGLAQARGDVDRAKHALGERKPVWWRDGTPDFNRHMAANTEFVGWFGWLKDGQ